MTRIVMLVLMTTLGAATSALAAEIDLENLDNGTPYHDRLAFSRINGGVTTHEFHDLVKLRIKNTGADPLVISGLAITGGDTSYFTLPNGELTTPPAPIAPGGQYDLDVKFQAGTSAGTKAMRESTLIITSNDADEGSLTVQLAGFNLAQPEGGNEPSLQQLLDVFGYRTQIVYAGQSLNQNGWVRAVGDEILSPYWQRADTSKPVSAIQLAAFHSQGNTATFRWFNKGSGSQTTIFTMRGVEAQSILPHRNGSTTQLSSATFTPSGSVFGLAVDGEKSDPALNSQSADTANGCPGPCGHHVRAWPVRDRSGRLVPNTYVISMDYSGINYDYNDNTILVSNIRPELADRDPGIPGLFPGAPGLVREFDQVYAGTLVDAQGEGVGFPDTQRNKNDNTTLPPPTASYDPAALNLDAGGAGTLTIATNAGSNGGNDNTLVNGLCLPFDGRGGAPFEVTTTVLGPVSNLTAANQQGGVMFGPNQDNYVKLAAIGQSGAPVLQLYQEQSGSGASVGATVAIASPANVTSLVLSLVADPRDGTVRGKYRITYSTGAPVTGTMPGVLTLTGTQYSRFFDRRAKGCLITMHKGATQVQLTFDRFAIASGETADPRPAIARINVGGPAYTDTLGNVWAPDTGLFTPSTAPVEGGPVVAIANTADDTVYQTYRGNVGSVPQAQRIITFAIPVGGATVVDARIHLAELYWGAPGGGAAGPVKRIFDIIAEGVTLVDDFDISAASGAARTAVIVPLEQIDVTDGTLTLAFKADLDFPAVAGIEVLVSAPECVTSADCGGSAPECKQIACVVGQCVVQNQPAGSACTSDGNTCTTDQCNASGVCTHANNTAPCNDGLFCNGADTCGGGSCSVHAGNPCTGGTECQNGCNEAADNCISPAGTPCTDDGNACTTDACNGSGNCAHLPNVAPCNDGLFCNGADTCSNGGCTVHAGNPCAGGGECADTCNEAGDTCAEPPGTACGSDGNPCTDDQCNGSGACVHVNNTAPCDADADVCTRDECNGAGACVNLGSAAGQPCDTGQPGACAAGVTACSNQTLTCGQSVQPAPEVCGNAEDDDCNGQVDDTAVCAEVCLPENTTPSTTQTRTAKFSLKPQPDRDKVSVKGSFTVPAGGFDPSASPVSVIARDANGLYFQAGVPAGSLTSKNGRTFRYKDRFEPFENGGLRDVGLSVGGDGVTVKFKFKAQALNLGDFVGPTGTLTVKIGDRCYTDTDDTCVIAASGAKCK